MGEGDKPKPGGPGPGDDTPAVGNAPDAAAPANTAADIMEARGEDLSGSDSDHSDFEKLDMPQPGEYVPEEYAAERARNPSGGGEKHKVRQEIG